MAACLPGHSGQGRELVAILDRTGRLHELVERGRQLRPAAAWDESPEVAGAGGRGPSPDRPAGPPPTTGTIVLLDNFEDLVEPATRRSTMRSWTRRWGRC